MWGAYASGLSYMAVHILPLSLLFFGAISLDKTDARWKLQHGRYSSEQAVQEITNANECRPLAWSTFALGLVCAAGASISYHLGV